MDSIPRRFFCITNSCTACPWSEISWLGERGKTLSSVRPLSPTGCYHLFSLVVVQPMSIIALPKVWPDPTPCVAYPVWITYVADRGGWDFGKDPYKPDTLVRPQSRDANTSFPGERKPPYQRDPKVDFDGLSPHSVLLAIQSSSERKRPRRRSD